MRRIITFILLTWLVPAPVAAQPTSTAIDSVGRALEANQPGAVVVGALRDTNTTVRGFGAVDSTGTSPTARTLFEIGSVTKTFTGLLLAGAVEQDTLSATTPVQALLPDSIGWSYADSVEGPAPTMALAHLATHRSGLPRLPTNLRAHALPGDPYAAYDDRALYPFLDGHTLPRAPGTKYAYSNLGMGLLGHLLARRTATTYAALVRRRIADPLGLSDTRTHLTDDQQTRFAQGHSRAGAPTSPWHFEALAGAGALRSTAADLLTYLRAHRRALATAPDTASVWQRAMRRALRPRAATGSDSTRIGLAWHITTRDGHPVAWHSGGTGGFRSMVALDCTTGRGAVVLVSTAIASEQVMEAAFALLEALRPASSTAHSSLPQSSRTRSCTP